MSLRAAEGSNNRTDQKSACKEMVREVFDCRSLQTVPNLFIFALSCSDILVCCFSATITPITALKKEWIFGELMCNVAPWIAVSFLKTVPRFGVLDFQSVLRKSRMVLFQGVSLCFSTFSLTAISIDRYILIKYPMKKAITKKQAGVIIFVSQKKRHRGLPKQSRTRERLGGFSEWSSRQGIVVAAVLICLPTAIKQTLTPFGSFCGLYCTEDWNVSFIERHLLPVCPNISSRVVRSVRNHHPDGVVFSHKENKDKMNP